MGCFTLLVYNGPTDTGKKGRMTRRRCEMKTVRIREKIKKFLGDRPRNTAEIFGTYQQYDETRHNQPATRNVLSKDKDIVKVGYIKRSGILSGGYDICEVGNKNMGIRQLPILGRRTTTYHRFRRKRTNKRPDSKKLITHENNFH